MRNEVYIDDQPGQKTEESPETNMVLTLKKPIRANEASSITELHLSEPTAGQWLEASAVSGPEGDLQLLAIVAKVPTSVLRQMAISDFSKAVRFLAGFANVSQGAGKD